MRSIDIHAHLTPQAFWKATENGGDWHGIRRETDQRGQPRPVIGGRPGAPLGPKTHWEPEQRLADMDSLGVDVHVLSPFSGFYNYQLDTQVAVATSRDSNDEIHQMVQSWPHRFAGLGTLPMQDVGAAIAELERCMTQLGFKGAMINDHVNGHWLDEPQYLPFWKAVEQMDALILFHQANRTLVSDRIERYHFPNTIGNLVDRAVTFSTLVMGGVLDACPNLKLCLSHGGGYTCYGIGRIDRGWRGLPPAGSKITQPPSAYLNRFYYDCIVYTEEALRFLIDSVGIDRVLFGTDWPYDMVFDWPVSWVLSLEGLTQAEKEAILWRNLEQLLKI